jgi:hypothetical protein
MLKSIKDIFEGLLQQINYKIMTTYNYGIATPMPEAHITRTKEKNRGRLKIYSNNTIYLEKGEEFEIEIFNPTQESILAKIEINGNLIANTGLVLKPAQRVYLERYFDVDRRFKFDVYEVENWEKLKKESEEITNNKVQLDKELSLRQQLLGLVSSEAEKTAIEERINELKTQTEEMKSLASELTKRSNSVQQATKFNGKVRILFYKESKPNDNFYGILNSSYNGTLNIGNSNFPLRSSGVKGSPKYKKSLFDGSTTTGALYSSASFTSGNNSCYDDMSMTFNSCCSDTTSLNLSDILSDATKSLNETKDTGRVEQGSISNQKFETVNMNFDSWTFHTIDYTLLPTSEKPLEVKDLKKYCNQCGKKLHPSDNFCSSCGTKS